MNEVHRKLQFPRDELELEKIATPLELPLENDVFDDVLRYYYVYLIMTVKEENVLPTTQPVSVIVIHSERIDS